MVVPEPLGNRLGSIDASELRVLQRCEISRRWLFPHLSHASADDELVSHSEIYTLLLGEWL